MKGKNSVAFVKTIALFLQTKFSTTYMQGPTLLQQKTKIYYFIPKIVMTFKNSKLFFHPIGNITITIMTGQRIYALLLPMNKN